MPAFDLEASREIARAQQSLQIERFHILQAAITGNYFIAASESRQPDGQTERLDPALSFQITLPDPLQPIRNVIFLDDEDRVSKDSAEALVESLQDIDGNEKYREGGILYLVSDAGIFWTMIELYRHNKTTGNKYWDGVLTEVSEHHNDPSHTDCMFFSTPFGCLQSTLDDHSGSASGPCLFRHDDKRKKQLRSRVVRDRLENLGAPTLEERQQFAREAIAQLTVRQGRQPTEDEMDDIFDQYVIGDGRARVFCRSCAKPEPSDQPFKRCKRCRGAWYCSIECQKKNWKVHEKNCIAWEKVVYRE